MCLIVWNWQPNSATPLLLLSNRDEFRQRSASPLHWWDAGSGAPQTPILAGRDNQAGGTWLGVNRSGRLAAITNFRSATQPRDDARSRGELVTQFLHGSQSASAFLHALQSHCQDYNPFNLLVFDGTTLLGLESRHARLVKLAPGWGGLSNADFNTPWPKLQRLRHGAQALPAPPLDAAGTDQALQLLQDRTPAADAELPRTGVPFALEQALSPVFIDLPQYGTRVSSVIQIGQTVHFTERVHPTDEPATTQTLQFTPLSRSDERG